MIIVFSIFLYFKSYQPFINSNFGADPGDPNKKNVSDPGDPKEKNVCDPSDPKSKIWW